MRNLRRRTLRAAVFGMFGVFAIVPAAHAATCVHAGGVNGTATLTFAAGDGTVTLSQDGSGSLTYAVGGGDALACGTSTLANSAQANAVGSASADTLVVDLTAGLLVRPDGSLTAIDASLSGGADAVDVRLPAEDDVVVGGTLGTDLDRDAAPDLTWAATERLTFTGQTGADDPEFGGNAAGLGDPLGIPVALAGGDGDDTLRGGLAGDTFAGGAAVTYDDRVGAISVAATGQATSGASGEGDTIGSDVEDLTGGSGADTLSGNLRDNVIDGGPGNDVVNGGRGADTLTGGAGNDAVTGGDGDDSPDEVARRLPRAQRQAHRHTRQGCERWRQGRGDNLLKTVEVVFAGSGADRLTAGTRAAVFHGGDGSDVLTGGSGEDHLCGGGGFDTAKRVGAGDRVLSCTIA